MKENVMKARKAAAVAAAGVLSSGMLLPMGSAFAAMNYTPVAGTSCTFSKYLIVEAGADVPNVTFSYTIAPGTAQSYDVSGEKVEVLAGVGSPTATSTTFANGDAVKTAAGQDIDVQRAASARKNGDTAETGVQFETAKGEKYATKTSTIDFSSVNFPEPGIYRYIVSETASATDEAAGLMHDTDTDRVLDVYVTDDGDGNLVVSGYVMHTDDDTVAMGASYGSADVATAGAALDDKTDGFTNEFKTSDLQFAKAVTGNQASRDKYFEFTVTATNVNDEDVFNVSIADDNNENTLDGNADATSGAQKNGGTIAANAGKTNPATVTGAQLKAGQKFYLQHGQNIVIHGLPINAGYTVAENAEDYKSTPAGVTGFADATTGTMTSDKKTSFLNTRDGIIPTGVLFPIVGGIAIAGAAGAGVLANRRRKEEE